MSNFRFPRLVSAGVFSLMMVLYIVVIISILIELPKLEHEHILTGHLILGFISAAWFIFCRDTKDLGLLFVITALGPVTLMTLIVLSDLQDVIKQEKDND